MLLGLGIPAWVAIGIGPRGGAHAWIAGIDPVHAPFVLEPQLRVTIWWGRTAPGYRMQLALGPHGCRRWDPRAEAWHPIDTLRPFG